MPRNEVSRFRKAGDYPAGRAIASASAPDAGEARRLSRHLLQMVRPLSDRGAGSALAQASASEARWQNNAPQGALDGIPVGFKDLLNVQGFPTRKGSLATSAQPQAEDCPAAARLRELGAVLLGKTQTAEFGMRGLTETKLAGITLTNRLNHVVHRRDPRPTCAIRCAGMVAVGGACALTWLSRVDLDSFFSCGF